MKSIKILAIGNSFSIDAMEYLWDFFKDASYDDVKLGNLYIGGCSLDTHWSNIENNSTAYVYSQNTNGQWRKSSDSINNVLSSEDWDIITIQQVSQESGLPTTYGNFDNIVEYIVKNKSENAKLYWHMTWAYQSDSTHWGFVNYDKDQMTMYNAIVKTVNDVVIKNPDIDGVIPSGTAIQNIRTSYLGDTLTRDGFHMSYDYGRYVTALTWFAYISGEDCSIVKYTPSKYPDLLLDRYVMYDAVNAAVRAPYSVTPSEYITKAEKYMPTEVRSYYETALSEKSCKFSAYDTANAPYAMQDVLTISSLKLKKISIPVYKTGSTGGDGKFTFTLFVHGGSLLGLKNSALRKYELKLEPREYDLPINEVVMKYVDIDVSGYDIKLSKGETLAMFAASDTIVPAYMRVADPNNGSVLNEAAEYIVEKFPQAQNGYKRVGQATMRLTSNIHLYDFEYDKMYVESELNAAEAEQAEYESLVAMLKEKYSEKYISILGDSISTFDGISNDTSHNSSLFSNLPHYKPSTTSPSTWEQTYWGRIIEETGMKLCVSNAWGGATLYGRHEPTNLSWDWTNYKDSAPNRASKLHRDDGTKPDVIIMYMGINDLQSGDGYPHGELYDRLRMVDQSKQKQWLDLWLSDILNSTNDGTYLTPGESYNTIDQAYALALYIMRQNYPHAEIICVGLMKNGNGVCTDDHMLEYNYAIEILAKHFGAVYVDQTELVKATELHCYGTDTTCVHPNSMGMELLSRRILTTWGKSKQN